VSDEIPSVPYVTPPADLVASFRSLRMMYNAAREAGFSGSEAMQMISAVLPKPDPTATVEEPK
jgi:hypothetical protein